MSGVGRDGDSQEHWGAMLRQALSMGIMPPVFWGLSVREWRMLNEGARALEACLSRLALDEMMERWPDAG